mgnify:FL=1|tara:strand:- start:2027 stop:2356 length:330 start_codon:yes stop_codon:yes gene_type:complete
MATFYKYVNGNRVEMTAEETKIREADLQTYIDEEKDRNLNEIRVIRKPLLDQADIEINKLEDAGGDASKWRAYRIELRDMTVGLDTVEKTRTKLEKDTDGSYKNFPSKP